MQHLINLYAKPLLYLLHFTLCTILMEYCPIYLMIIETSK